MCWDSGLLISQRNSHLLLIDLVLGGFAFIWALWGGRRVLSYSDIIYVLAGPARAARSSLSVPHLSWTGRMSYHTLTVMDHLPVLPCGSDATRGIGASIGRIRSSNPLRNHPCSLLWGSEKTPRGLREGTGEGRSMYRQRRKQGLQIRIHCDRTAT